MLIVCPNCATSYRVEPSSLSAAGRSVRCVRCRTIWFARDPGALAAVTQNYLTDATSLTTTAVTVAGLAEPPAPPAVASAAPDEPPAAVDAIEAEHLPEPGPAVVDAAPAEEVPPVAAEWPDQDLPAPPEPVPNVGTPAPAPIEHDGAALHADVTPAEDIETFAARRMRRKAARRRAYWPMPGLPSA